MKKGTMQSGQSQVNLFRSFPASFFNPLTGMNRGLMEIALSCLYIKTSYGTSYTLTYEDACSAVEDALEGQQYETDMDEEMPDNTHDLAVFVLRRLRACGWISEEIGENYQRFLHFEDYAIELLQAVRRTGSGETEEYSGYFYTIFQLLRSIEPTHGDLAIEQAVSNTEALFRQLSTLNTNIKKYIQRVLDEENKDNLKNLMEMLLVDYQSQVIDRAYYNLTTHDNPEKYRGSVLNSLAKIQADDTLLDLMARKRMERKACSYEDAYEKLLEQLNYLEVSFDSVPGLMDEIDRKNHKYITSAIARITFLLEAHDDLEGKINRILKALISNQISADQLFDLYRVAYLDGDSLYTIKKKRLKVKKSIADEPEIDEDALRDFAEMLAREQQFSRKNVERHLLQILGEKNGINASDMKLDDFESFAFLVLGYLYGHDADGELEIADLNEWVHVGGYRFMDFTIRRKVNG